MKKYTVLFVVLIAVLAFGSVGYAYCPPQDECPWIEGRLGNVKGTLSVVGTVGPYAAIKICPNDLELEWTGQGYQTSAATTGLEIKSNTKIKLDVSFKPLTHADWFMNDKIETTVALTKEMGIFTRTWSATTKNNEATFTAGFLFTGLQGVEHRSYDVVVSGQLGDIHEQAAGEYKTDVIFTVSKAS